jgi:hypothetical protein
VSPGGISPPQKGQRSRRYGLPVESKRALILMSTFRIERVFIDGRIHASSFASHTISPFFSAE